MEMWKLLAGGGVLLVFVADRVAAHLIDKGKFMPAFYTVKVVAYVVVAIMWLAIWKK